MSAGTASRGASLFISSVQWEQMDFHQGVIQNTVNQAVAMISAGDLAFRYAECGIPVFSMRGIIDQKCTCNERGSAAAGKHLLYALKLHPGDGDQAQ